MKKIDDLVLREFYRGVRDRGHAGCIIMATVIGCGVFVFGAYALIALICPLILLVMIENLGARLRHGTARLTPRELKSLNEWLDHHGERVTGLSLPG